MCPFFSASSGSFEARRVQLVLPGGATGYHAQRGEQETNKSLLFRGISSVTTTPLGRCSHGAFATGLVEMRANDDVKFFFR